MRLSLGGEAFNGVVSKITECLSSVSRYYDAMARKAEEEVRILSDPEYKHARKEADIEEARLAKMRATDGLSRFNHQNRPQQRPQNQQNQNSNKKNRGTWRDGQQTRPLNKEDKPEPTKLAVVSEAKTEPKPQSNHKDDKPLTHRMDLTHLAVEKKEGEAR